MTESLTKLWGALSPAERRKLPWMLLLVVMMTAVETLGVLSIMPFLSALARPEFIHENQWLQAAYERFGFNSTREFIIALGLASITTVITASAFKTITLHVLNRFTNLTRHSLSTRLLKSYLNQPYEFFLHHNPSVLAKNVLSETDQLVLGLLQPLSRLIAHGMIVVAMALLIFLYDPITALCIVAVLALMYGVIYGVVRKRLLRIGHERQTANAMRYQACNEALGGIKEVKVTHSHDAYLERFAKPSRDFSRHLATSETLSQSPLYLVEAVGYSGLILIALALLTRSNDIAQVLPALGLYGLAAYRMLPAAQIMYRGFAQMRSSTTALNSLHRDLTLPQHLTNPATDSIPFKKEIRLSGVRYAYPSSPHKPVFDNFDLVIPAGTFMSIHGESGAGKSTLMDILLGLLTPQAGTLSIDGVKITSENVNSWQRSIGYVPQTIYLADTSIAENIAFGVAKKDIDMDAVEHAAKAAQIHEFINNELDSKYNTKIGDRGIRLSGGQRQRVGIARALYNSPSIIFMDEATNALDSATETITLDALRLLDKVRTIVLITHRPSPPPPFKAINLSITK